jgi:hypothetical protein
MRSAEDFKGEAPFRAAAEGMRLALSILPGIEISDREAELATTLALVAFTNANGVDEHNRGRLEDLAPEMDQAQGRPSASES